MSKVHIYSSIVLVRFSTILMLAFACALIVSRFVHVAHFLFFSYWEVGLDMRQNTTVF